MLLKKQAISIFDVCLTSVPAMLYYILRFIILLRCSRRKNNISISQRKKSTNFKVPCPLFYAPMPLSLGFIAANAAADEAARMAARARRARQLVGKEILRCYQWILLLYSLYTSAGR